MSGGPPLAVSAERVAFLQPTCVWYNGQMCIQSNMAESTSVIFIPWKIKHCPWEVLEKSLNFDLPKLYEPCWTHWECCVWQAFDNILMELWGVWRSWFQFPSEYHLTVPFSPSYLKLYAKLQAVKQMEEKLSVSTYVVLSSCTFLRPFLKVTFHTTLHRIMLLYF